MHNALSRDNIVIIFKQHKRKLKKKEKKRKKLKEECVGGVVILRFERRKIDCLGGAVILYVAILLSKENKASIM